MERGEDVEDETTAACGREDESLLTITIRVCECYDCMRRELNELTGMCRATNAERCTHAMIVISVIVMKSTNPCEK